jgi:hypothetical protein
MRGQCPRWLVDAGSQHGACQQTKLAGALVKQTPRLPRLVFDFGQDLPWDAGLLAGLVAPVLVPPVVEDAASRAGRIGAHIIGQAVREVVLGLAVES